MHKLHECVTKEINDIVRHGITTSNIEILGELVDIRKDIEEMWHWRGEYEDKYKEHEQMYYDEAKHHDGVDALNELIDSVKSINDKLKTTDSPELVSKLKKEAKELYECAEKIKHTFEVVKLDADLTMKFKNIFM